MFDIDGTLIESFDFDANCFKTAVQDVLDTTIDTNWGNYDHVTDSGILNQILDELNPSGDREFIIASIKKRFIEHVSDYLKKNDVSPIRGASDFLPHLMDRKNVKLAMATGGWFESALLKLKAAGLYKQGIPMASSSDHFSRMEIMKIAESRCGTSQYESKTYFGDAQWDLKASEALGYNFVLVGKRFKYKPSFQDYSAKEAIMNHIGL